MVLWDSELNDPTYLGEMYSDFVDIPPDPSPVCLLAALTTHRANVSQVQVKGESFCELDSHADTCCFGPSAYIIRDTDKTISVTGFHEDLGTVNDVPIVTAAVAYDCALTGHTFILFFHHSLYFDSMTKHLICPAQLRSNGVTVNDIPLLHLPLRDRAPEAHSIITMPPHPSVHIPLSLRGPTSYFLVRKPTFHEINSEYECTHVHMTSEQVWEPYDNDMETAEASIRASLDQPPRERGRELDAAQGRYDFDSVYRLHYESSVVLAALDSQFVPPRKVDPHRIVQALKMTETLPISLKGKISPAELAKRWRVGVETAKATLARTTQLAIRDYSHSTGGRRLKPFAYQLRYRRLNVEMYTDTLIGRSKSFQGNSYAQVYATPFHWVAVIPMAKKSEAHYTLDTLFRKVGVPRVMIPDNAKELTEGWFKRKVQRASSTLHPIEPYTPNANRCEDVIRELKRSYRRIMLDTNCPQCFWDLCLQYTATVRSHTALSIRELEGEVPHTVLTGDTPDISHIAEFGWYDWCWFISPEDVTLLRKSLGRYLGPSTDVGDALCSRVLTDKGTIVNRTSVFPLSDEERRSEQVVVQKQSYEDLLKVALGKHYILAKDVPNEEGEDTPEFQEYEPILEEEPKVEPLQEADDTEVETLDKYISARVYLPQGDSKSYGTVKRRVRDHDGELVGRSNDNPLLDTSVYEVEFDSGEVEAYHANIIAESIYHKVDADGYSTYMLREIIDHRTTQDALKLDDAYYFDKRSGKQKLKQTTKGWELCVRWNDESTTWVPLKDIKESNPVEVAEYAVHMKLVSEPAFAWWMPFVIKKRDRLIKAVKKRYFRKHQKFGIELPKTVKRALEIDKETNTTFWADAIKKEMKGVWKAFDILDEGAATPVGHTKITCHMVFDIKPDFTRKARLVAGGHMTDPPSSMTYASVVSRESVRIALMLATLNNLEILSADIGNAYLNARTKEKIYIICGPEFGEQFAGRIAIIVRALYGLKSSGAAWRSCLAQVLREEFGFKPCRADNDVWYRPTQKASGERYYEYVLVYTDDMLAISMNPRDILEKVDQHFLLKDGTIGSPKIYLGTLITKHKFENGDECWAMGSDQYVADAIKNVQTWLSKRNLMLKSKVSSTLPSAYVPEMDATPYLSDEDANYYQQQIGVLRWAVELGRIDICAEASIMAGFSAAPREGHLDAVMHVFAWLKCHTRSKIVLDPDYPEYEEMEKPDWSEFYEDAKELLPPDMPEPLGNPVVMTTFVDSDHAGDKVTRRSRTGVLIFLNRAPVVWYSKKQNSIETSSFGSEFTAMKVGVEISEGLRYKLRMMGVPIAGSTQVRADNMSVVKNTSIPESTLKKKSNSIAYHYVRERAASGAIAVSYEPTHSNLADMLTKIQSGIVRKRLISRVLF
jgi:Reverse transcriptase (RNA-dependent DNA polymerase)